MSGPTVTTWPNELTELYHWLTDYAAARARKHGMGAVSAEVVATEAVHRAVATWDAYDPSRVGQSGNATTRKAWLAQIIRSVIRDRGRADWDGPTLSLDAPIGVEDGETLTLADTIPNGQADVLTHAGTVAAHHAEEAEARDAVHAVLADLLPEYRKVLELRYLRGMSHKEIGSLMGIPEGTARVWVHRALKPLKASAVTEAA